MKKILSLLFAAATLASSLAATAIYNPTATTAASVIQGSAKINQIIFSNAATNAVTLTFYDAPTNVLTWVAGAYTNNVYSVGTVILPYTNRLGVVTGYTNSTLTSTLTPVAQSTNNYRTALVQLVPASSTVTYTPPNGNFVGYGLAAATTATNVVAVVTYSPTQ